MKDGFGRDLRCESTGKICYTEREAGIALNEAKKHHYSDDNTSKEIPKRKYYCEKCGCYHLTHQTFYKSNKPQREFRQKLRALIAFEDDRAWREEYRLLYVA